MDIKCRREAAHAAELGSVMCSVLGGAAFALDDRRVPIWIPGPNLIFVLLRATGSSNAMSKEKEYRCQCEPSLTEAGKSMKFVYYVLGPTWHRSDIT